MSQSLAVESFTLLSCGCQIRRINLDTQGPAGILYNIVKSQLGASASLIEIETQVQAVAESAGIPGTVADEVLTRFRAELQSSGSGQDVAPRLLVDWGELPRVGNQVRPEFSLLCPKYASKPELHISVDRDLDHNPQDPLRRPQEDEPGLWTFHVPFRMTSDGLDCRPGQYLINVELAFRDVPPELPRFYRCRIRLNVPHAGAEEGGVLEIDGDGQSMVNLQGYNLKQFSKVILKGGQDSVINLQNGIAGPCDTETKTPEKPTTTFEYQLKVNTEKQSRLPTVSSTLTQRTYLDAAGFLFDDGRRTLVMTRPRITFGRSRDNDVVLRFLPRSEENDDHSRNISRTHFLVELIPDGIEIQDVSQSGIEVNYSVVRERHVLPTLRAGDVTHIDLGVTGIVPKQFKLEMLMLAPDRREDRDELEYWDELYCELVGGRLSRIAREALDLRLNAIRFDRAENLAGEESYVLLLREALIGGSPAQSAVVLKESGPQSRARLLHMDRSFWLEPLPGGGPISIDSQPLSPRSLTPLSPGMEIQFGTEVVRFDRPTQLYLD